MQEIMQAWRHDIHRHPELGFAIERTAAKVAELLQGFGVEVRRGIGGTGVVGGAARQVASGSLAALKVDADCPTCGASLHNPRYDLNDEILTVGCDFWVTLARQQLQL